MLETEKWQKAKEIFQTAMDLPLTERQAFIENESNGDELIKAEVETLLEAHDEAGNFIVAPAVAVTDFFESEQRSSFVGKQIGAYNILEEIGRGGMGAVYLDLDERLKLFLEVCSAVQYAHRNLIVHRDLKPSNILVSEDETPKLLDFGIAKLLTPFAEFATGQTATNFNVMTPEYASPEQVRGETVTTATDVYSLGVVLYEILTGNRPYSFQNQSLENIIHTVCHSEPRKPSSVLNGKWNSENPKSKIQNLKLLKGDLDNIVLMAMRKEPERRYSSVEQFAEDIRRYQNGLPVIAREDSFSYRAEKFIQRNKVGVVAASGIAVSLIAGIFTTTAFQDSAVKILSAKIGQKITIKTLA